MGCVGRFWCLIHYPLLWRFSILLFKKNDNTPSDLVPLLHLNPWHLAPPHHLPLSQLPLLKVSPNVISWSVLIVGSQRHTVDLCYKLHGYPPGYKPKPKAQLSSLPSTNIDNLDRLSFIVWYSFSKFWNMEFSFY